MNSIAEKSQAKQTAEDIAIAQSQRANELYHQKFDAMLYRDAISGLGIARTNLLIDDAMALCGHPRYSLSWTRWGEEAYKFLAQFTQPNMDLTEELGEIKDWVECIKFAGPDAAQYRQGQQRTLERIRFLQAKSQTRSI